MSLIIVLITIVVSLIAFNNQKLADDLSFKPSLVYHKYHWHRFITHSLVHGGWSHLLINMYVLYIFGDVCEQYFAIYFGSKSSLYFIQLYVLSLIVSSLFGLFKHRNNTWYTAVGASGAVMAVVFTSIFFDPWNMLYFFGIIPIPGIVFGVLYLFYSVYMGKRNNDNIGHDAHILGAIFGFIYPVIINPKLLEMFIEKLLNR